MRHIGNGRMIASNQKELATWRQDVALAAKQAWVESGMLIKFDGAVRLDIKFCVPRKRAAAKRKYPITPYDLDKLCRAIGDALSVNLDLITNDAQICELNAVKVFADDCIFGAHISVTELL